MSKEELESEYQEGNLSRRDFIRRLTGLGVSIALANRLADTAEAKENNGKAKGKYKNKKKKKGPKDDTYNRW